MSRGDPRRGNPCRHARGVTLVEAIVSTAIVAMLLVAAMDTVWRGTQLGRQKTSNQVRAQLLANDLLTEILSKPYRDPSGSSSLGIDVAESLGANRLSCDDIDDYDGLTDGPPTSADGSAMDGFDSHWKRSASVGYVDPAHPSQTVASDAGVKQIVIQVKYDNVVVAQLSAIRTREWQSGSTP